MPRPVKSRLVQGPPRVTCFKPRGVPTVLLETVTLGLDELEAIRLVDLEDLYQEEAADRMNISRPTFGRVLGQARRTVADALLNGKALVFEGGPVALAGPCRFACRRCGASWEVPADADRPGGCTVCGSEEVRGAGPEDAAHPGCRRRRGRGSGGRSGPEPGQCPST